MATPDLIRLDIVVDEEQYDTVAGLLVRNISYGWEEDSLPTGETRFRVHCDNAIVQENLLSALAGMAAGPRRRTDQHPASGLDRSVARVLHARPRRTVHRASAVAA